jgi:chromosome segregation ATPase
MTVPGKGGRPRKWRSDADRVRAFRARERGDDEPPTIEVALESGDEAAVAWDQVRQLGDTIDALKAELKTTQTALRRAEKELEREQVRSNWISERNDRLRTELDDAERDRANMQDRLDELVHTKITLAPNARSTHGPNRAQRRQAERQRRRPT